MARALRFDVANSLHHVTNRGLERRDIVRDDKDRQEVRAVAGASGDSAWMARVCLGAARQSFSFVLADSDRLTVGGDARF